MSKKRVISVQELFDPGRFQYRLRLVVLPQDLEDDSSDSGRSRDVAMAWLLYPPR